MRTLKSQGRKYALAALAITLLSLAAPVPTDAAGASACTAYEFDSCRQCIGGKGDDIPIPFGLSNQRVELAERESYYLQGTVVVLDGHPYLKVDLQAHPWLANARRVAFPYYPLDGGLEYWKAYRDREIQIYARALLIFLADTHGGRVMLGLRALMQPHER